MENPSLRMDGHGGGMNRTFMVEDYGEENLDNGPQTKELVSKVTLIMKGGVFWTWIDNE